MINFIAGQRVGKYEIKKFLGSGAFGSVYEAIDTLLQRHCALKFVKNPNPTQFVAHYEAVVLNKCRHDRIVSVHAVDALRLQNGETLAVIEMEYCGDGSVDVLLQKQFLSIRRSVKVVIDVCYGLEHAHRQSILHRDVKPPNIMIVGSRHKLSDFGLAKNGLIGSGAGTPIYNAPELQNNNLANVKTEVFAVGMTFFQLSNNYCDLAAGITSLDTIRKCAVIKTRGYERFVPDKIRRICNKACNADPDKRYGTIEELRQTLERLEIEQDWNRVSDTHWAAEQERRKLELTILASNKITGFYRINGRRQSANTSTFVDIHAAKNWQQEWVCKHTFA